MNELPKSVRDELARQQRRGVVHPDADLLAAYAENTATPAERAKLEEHLASCSECREVMFLAAPEVESTAPVKAVAPKTGKFWLRVWAPWATAAVVLIVATFAFINKDGHSPQLQRMAKNESSPQPAQQQPPEVVTSTPAPKSDLKKSPPVRSSDEQLHSAPEALDKTKQKDAKVEAGRRDKEDSEAYAFKKSESDSVAGGFVAGAPPPTPPPPPSVATTEIYASNRADRNTTLKPGPAAPMQNQVMQNQQNQSLQDLRASKSSEAVVVNSAPVMEAQAKTDRLAGISAFKVDARGLSQWRISASGNVERSSGSNWTTVLTQPGTKFTVVATVGPIVWAGGTGGVLLRSLDNGASWQSIQLPKLSSDASSTITKIEFRDAFTGTVSTADHRSWSTKDRGENWQQP